MKRLVTLLAVILCLAFAHPVFAVQQLIQSGVATPIPFLLVDAATGQIGQTGQSSNITLTVAKPGTTSYVASSGSITEIGNGLYQYTPTTTETGSGTTFGTLLIHVTDSTVNAQVVDVAVQIVAFNPNDAAALGLSTIVSTGTSASAASTTAAAINTKLGTPAGASVSADIAAIWNGTGITIAANHSSTNTSFVLSLRQYLLVSLSVLNGDASNSSVTPNSTVPLNYYLAGAVKASGNIVAVSSPTFDSNGRSLGRTIIFEASDASL